MAVARLLTHRPTISRHPRTDRSSSVLVQNPPNKLLLGRIVNTASGAARGGVSNVGHYAMAKGAIASLTYAAATDWSRFG